MLCVIQGTSIQNQYLTAQHNSSAQWKRGGSKTRERSALHSRAEYKVSA